MNSGLSVLALLGMTWLVAAGCEPVADLGHDGAPGSGGLGGEGGSVGTKSDVGEPCIPEDEYLTSFHGFSVEEVNIESNSLQCKTGVCLVNHFQGRVSCPYGNSLSNLNLAKGQTPPNCSIPGTSQPITVAVDPQIVNRRAQDAVYCSCRCAGPDKNAEYCDCPSGYQCVELAEALPLDDNDQYAGAYCVREDALYVKHQLDVTDTCTYMTPFEGPNCGEITATGEPK